MYAIFWEEKCYLYGIFNYSVEIVFKRVSFCHRSIFFGFTAGILLTHSGAYVVPIPTYKILNRDGPITNGHTHDYLLKGLIFRRIYASVKPFPLG